MARAFIAVGSSIDPEKNIPQSLRLLEHAARLTAISTFYRNPAIGRPREAPFYNGVVAIETQISPIEFKYQVLRRIEAALGRHRGSDKYAPRTIDLDLLLYDQCVVTQNDLVLPDPHISSRAFVAVPLCELDPDLLLPGSAAAIRDVAGSLTTNQMQPLRDFTQELRRIFNIGPLSRQMNF